MILWIHTWCLNVLLIRIDSKNRNRAVLVAVRDLGGWSWKRCDHHLKRDIPGDCILKVWLDTMSLLCGLSIVPDKPYNTF